LDDATKVKKTSIEAYKAGPREDFVGEFWTRIWVEGLESAQQPPLLQLKVPTAGNHID